jgi:hypothetical protein
MALKDNRFKTVLKAPPAEERGVGDEWAQN